MTLIFNFQLDWKEAQRYELYFETHSLSGRQTWQIRQSQQAAGNDKTQTCCHQTTPYKVSKTILFNTNLDKIGVNSDKFWIYVKLL